ncbi:MAG: hypothetical protein ACOCWZ_01300 [Spirochaetota bacterium]
MKVIKIFLSLMFAAIILVSCGPSPRHLRSLNDDYFRTGFLSDDLYQVIVTGNPDPNVKGLVARRESARLNALSDIDDSIVDSLYSEWKSTRGASLKGIPEVKFRNYIRSQLSVFIDSGCIVEKYYNQDHSISIVYRIHSSNLRDAIVSLTIPDKLILDGEKTNETST